jgi:hypothetical protein
MNDQLQNALVAIINKAGQGVDAGVSFLQAQLPDVIQQLLLWKLVASLLVFIALISACAGLAWIMMKAYRVGKLRRDLASELHRVERMTERFRYFMRTQTDEEAKKEEDCREQERVIREQLSALPDIGQFTYALGALYLPIILGICGWGFTWLQILIAPKLYLIEYAASLTK